MPLPEVDPDRVRERVERIPLGRASTVSGVRTYRHSAKGTSWFVTTPGSDEVTECHTVEDTVTAILRLRVSASPHAG